MSKNSAGFTLLELLAAFVIFGLMATTVLVDLDRATGRALRAVRARELRVLAEERLGRIAVFEVEYDEIFDRTSFDDLDDERWKGWEWQLDIRDVVVFGESSDERAEYLFGDPPDAEDETASATGGSGNTPTKGKEQYLRELTLTVFSPDADGAEADSVSIVTFLPFVERSAAPAAPAGGGGGDGDGDGR